MPHDVHSRTRVARSSSLPAPSSLTYVISSSPSGWRRAGPGGARFEALHAAPLDPLYQYLPPETPEAEWERQLAGVDADWLLHGHTHRPLLARFGAVTVLNPGSVGQPRMGAPLASYAIWDDGDVYFAARRYDTERTVGRLQQLPLERGDTAELVRIVRTGATRGRAPVPGAGDAGP